MSWDPFRELEDMMKMMGGGHFGGHHGFSSSSSSSSSSLRGLGRSAPMDLKETPSHYLLSADLPGMKKEDMEVNVKNNTVCVKSNRPLPSSNNGASEEEVWMHCAERPFGKYERCFQLGSKINEQNVDASYVDGVLEVKMAKMESTPTSANRTINIQ